MTPQELSKMYGINLYATNLNLAGITHQESLVAPQPGGNCLNWNLGHIVASRADVLKLVGEAPVWSEEEGKPYARGSKSWDPGKARTLDTIVQDLERSQERLEKALTSMAPERLNEVQGDKPLGEKLAVLQFHEGYHIGQIGLLRRLLGKAGAIA